MSYNRDEYIYDNKLSIKIIVINNNNNNNNNKDENKRKC